MTYYVEINDGEAEFEIIDCIVRSRGSGDIDIILSFHKIPDVLLKCATQGVIVDKIRLFDDEWRNVKKYLSSYNHIIITQTITSGFVEKIYMKALRMEGYFDKNKNHRTCFKPGCNYYINPIVVMGKLLSMVDEETAENMWDDETTQFYCCFCFSEWNGV